MMKHKTQILTAGVVIVLGVVAAFLIIKTSDKILDIKNTNSNTSADVFTEDKKVDNLVFSNIGTGVENGIYHLYMNVKNTSNKKVSTMTYTINFVDENNNGITSDKLTIYELDAGKDRNLDIIITQDAYSSYNFTIKKK